MSVCINAYGEHVHKYLSANKHKYKYVHVYVCMHVRMHLYVRQALSWFVDNFKGQWKC